ncbi:hypothetical protein OIDMADRAFT_21072 [Oidiodendron maius Zn]|uniref:Uncharacterized protein n=1 Tax=Oidiodendron maius (strain Zn) TaxID=913774 RepID=A0A0C3C8F0_OIDMZ|nr:hypothetical protein OIDMADRAFT_21072 [Oidiodendron maius Zn]
MRIVKPYTLFTSADSLPSLSILSAPPMLEFRSVSYDLIYRDPHSIIYHCTINASTHSTHCIPSSSLRKFNSTHPAMSMDSDSVLGPSQHQDCAPVPEG